VNYGALPTDPVAIQHVHGQVLGTFGALDRGIPPGTVQTFEQGMKAAYKSVEIKIYHGAGHGFQNPAHTRGIDQSPRPTRGPALWRSSPSLTSQQLAESTTHGEIVSKKTASSYWTDAVLERLTFSCYWAFGNGTPCGNYTVATHNRYRKSSDETQLQSW
jgi:dienelactone hydrolase